MRGKKKCGNREMQNYNLLHILFLKNKIWNKASQIEETKKQSVKRKFTLCLNSFTREQRVSAYDGVAQQHQQIDKRYAGDHDKHKLSEKFCISIAVNDGPSRLPQYNSTVRPGSSPPVDDVQLLASPCHRHRI